MDGAPRVMILLESSQEITRGIIRGIIRYIKIFGPWAVFSDQSLYLEPGRKKSIFHHVKRWNPNGIIAGIPRQVIGDEFLAAGIPTVAFLEGSDIENFPAVITYDYEELGAMAADYLIKQGFKHFAYCGYSGVRSERQAESFAQYLEVQGRSSFYYYSPSTSTTENLWSNEQIKLSLWLKSLPKPIVVLAFNDLRGRDVAEACRQASLRIPEDVSILGIDNDELPCNMANPPLSSIAMDFEKVGYEAASLLDRLMHGEKIEEQELLIRPTHVVPRASTDIATTEDCVVAEAIRYIRLNVKRPIQVSEVAEAVLSSRRNLYNRFQISIRRSVHEAITQIRIERIIQMLLETNLSISQIADEMGFPGVDHFARYFRKTKGITPQEFRKRHTLK
jgi:LacI family transcriptional regulator